jgi:flagellar FliL protein
VERPGKGRSDGKKDPAKNAALNDALTVIGEGRRHGRTPFARPGQDMAKSAKTKEEGAADEAPKGGKKKLIIIVVGAVVLLGAAGGGAWFFLKKPPAQEQAAEAAKAKKPVTFLDMKDMMVGMASGGQQDRQAVMKIKVSLEIGDPKVADEVKPLLPRVEDAFQVFMRELRPSDLEGSAGMYRLKEELLRRVNMTVYPAKVDAVLFKELLVQ